MKKNKIRLTESGLKRIVNESVKRVLNEVRFGGKSFHGNDPIDWQTMSRLRHLQSAGLGNKLAKKYRSQYSYGWSNDEKKRAEHYQTQGMNDSNNADEILLGRRNVKADDWPKIWDNDSKARREVERICMRKNINPYGITGKGYVYNDDTGEVELWNGMQPGKEEWYTTGIPYINGMPFGGH